jgi:cell division cycle 14
MNWIIPGKILATSSFSVCESEGQDPRLLIPKFKKQNITAVVRLNEKLYEDKHFENNGIRVYPMECRDGQAPNDLSIIDFIKICDAEIELRKAAIVVHCRAGLGRTGTMISAYLMWKYDMKA